ncbi:conserved hypothetical protein [Perkinsus marinus ATCC 50983]|uniref:Aminotransferase class I/classII large domain-containing protein n=1 Tax=Perkinsus marinus (strain ATCC 50983 / TXsc) TaxID=423536 RepID=C5LAZ5_PERM5|nr:conserved hypothetical protein [Perkinsus marinus ATCC 50983]EER06089.1 conserved hypothetical protein [Perkinsus marinus ATCC 50983]|eukprot:XP_002774273.1 conserved hypothetical protein [Perkinsus marinus ATCC 50983]
MQPTVQLSDFCQTKVSANRINFAIGQPSDAVVPTKILKEAIEVGCAAAVEDWCMYQYATTQGPLKFREALAKMLSSSYSTAVQPDHLVLTSGISAALSILAKGVVGGPGSVVLVENNTYFLAGNIFKEVGASLIPVPIDEEGLIPDELESILRREKVSALYTIPVHHNPQGTVMSVGRQKAVMELAVKYDFLVISDEPYGLLHYEDVSKSAQGGIRSLMQVAGMKDDWMRHCVVCGSFSKILAPGLRLGWYHTHPENIPKILSSGVLLSGGGPPPVLVEAVTELMRSGRLEEHLDDLRRIYGSRLAAMVAALEEEMSDYVTFHKPNGGYFLWLKFKKLPAGKDTTEFLEFCRDKGVGFLPGARTSVDGSCGHDCIRLSFAFYTEPEIRSGIHKLAEAWEQFCGE